MFRKIKNKNALKSMLLVMFLPFVFLFAGCANITYYVNPVGDYYAEGVNIFLSQQDAVKYGYDMPTLINQVSSILNDQTQAINNQFSSQLTKCFTDEKISYDEYVYLSQVKPFAAVPSYNIASNGYYLNIEVQIYPVQTENFSFSIGQIVNIYNYADTVRPEESEKEDTSFLTDIVVAYLKGDKQDGVFNNEDIDAYATLFLQTLHYEDYGLTKDDANYSYQFYTTSRRLHSNADSVTYKNGYYIHTWNIEKDEDGNVINKEYVFYNTIPKTTFWYWIGLCVTAVAGGIITLILYLKHKNKLKDNIVKLNENNQNF